MPVANAEDERNHAVARARLSKPLQTPLQRIRPPNGIIRRRVVAQILGHVLPNILKRLDLGNDLDEAIVDGRRDDAVRRQAKVQPILL